VKVYAIKYRLDVTEVYNVDSKYFSMWQIFKAIEVKQNFLQWNWIFNKEFHPRQINIKTK